MAQCEFGKVCPVKKLHEQMDLLKQDRSLTHIIFNDQHLDTQDRAMELSHANTINREITEVNREIENFEVCIYCRT